MASRVEPERARIESGGGESVLASLEAAQCEWMAGTFSCDTPGGSLSLSSVAGPCRKTCDALWTALGRSGVPERRYAKTAAEEGKSVQVDDCTREPRFVSADSGVRSAYFVPLASEDRVRSVLMLLAQEREAFGQPQRAVIDAFVHHAEESGRQQRTLELRLCQLEELLQRFVLSLEEVGLWGEAAQRELPEELIRGLGTLSSREWQVLRSIASGQRVSTIARELIISEHTVRNHLKSIFRKLGVRSQAELLERVGPGFRRRGAATRRAQDADPRLG